MIFPSSSSRVIFKRKSKNHQAFVTLIDYLLKNFVCWKNEGYDNYRDSWIGIEVLKSALFTFSFLIIKREYFLLASDYILFNTES